MARAAAVKASFDEKVMRRLASAGGIERSCASNLKGRERAEEKVGMDYGGDVTLLKDLLRCLVRERACVCVLGWCWDETVVVLTWRVAVVLARRWYAARSRTLSWSPIASSTSATCC